MIGGLTFRAASAADRDKTIELWRVCGLTVSHNPPEVDFERAVASASSTIILALNGKEPIGSAMVGDDGHRAVVYYLAVHPAAQYAGVGRQLMSQAEEWATSRGARKLNLMIRQDNAAVRAFYAAIGYEETPRLVMAKWLDT